MPYNAISNISGNVSQFTNYVDIVLNHAGALSAYQKKLTIPYDVAMQTNFNDIRFNIWNGTAWEYVPHWIESKTDSVTADVWIKNDYNSGDTTVRMYYGNGDVSSGSNGDDVFNFFEDFSNDLSKWTPVQGTWEISGGMLHATSTGVPDRIKAPVTINEFILEGEFKFTALTGACFPEMVYGDRADDIGIYIAGTTAAYNLYVDQVGGPNAVWDKDTNLHTFKLTRDSSSLIKFYYDGTLKGSKTDSATVSFNNVMIESHGSTVSYVDNLKVRQYTTAEPTYTIGTPQYQRRHSQFI